MKFKIYNENGITKISRISPSEAEQVIFSNIQPGQVAEIEVEAYTSYSTDLAQIDPIEKK